MQPVQRADVPSTHQHVARTGVGVASAIAACKVAASPCVPTNSMHPSQPRLASVHLAATCGPGDLAHPADVARDQAGGVALPTDQVDVKVQRVLRAFHAPATPPHPPSSNAWYCTRRDPNPAPRTAPAPHPAPGRRVPPCHARHGTPSTTPRMARLRGTDAASSAAHPKADPRQS